jgi:V8-like Glu-specific endopeptidase
MAILEVDGIPSNKKSLTLSKRKVYKNLRLGIIGHPHGGPQPDKKSFDITDNCKVINTDFDSSNREKVFTHHCDTLPGNSGSPIFDFNTGEVIGLHWGSNDALDVNLAIKMNEIIIKHLE